MVQNDYGDTGNDTFGFYALGHFQVSDFIVGDDRLFFDSAEIGVNNLEELVSDITGFEVQWYENVR